MASAYWKKYTLQFQKASGTSRGVLRTKTSWFLIWEQDDFEYPAVGECSIIEGLSPDPMDEIEVKLHEVCHWLNQGQLNRPDLSAFPSIRFGLEMLQEDRKAKGSKRLFPNAFTYGNTGMKINGLIWMNPIDRMKKDVKEKVEQGFDCIKIKIGALDFEQEIAFLEWIRKEFKDEKLELRVDANGAFKPQEALEKLNRLSEFDLHSIEQPIAARQWDEMARLCDSSPVPIALDEELIGINRVGTKEIVLDTINPQYIILKPSLIGGWLSSDEWITVAKQRNIGWWATSALESNVGLNAIAQYTFSKDVDLPQGLGTGSLYTNNLDSPLYIQGQFIRYNTKEHWNFTPLSI